MQQHSAAEIAKVIKDSFPDTDEAILESSVARYKDIDAYSATPVMSEESFNRLQTVMTSAGELEKQAPYADIVNNTYAEKAIG